MDDEWAWVDVDSDGIRGAAYVNEAGELVNGDGSPAPAEVAMALEDMIARIKRLAEMRGLALEELGVDECDLLKSEPGDRDA